MKRNLVLSKLIGASLIIALLFLFISPEIAEARRGSFGGGRSFGRSRPSYSRPSTPSRQRSFNRKPPTPRVQPLPANKRSSFGGNRISTAKDYTRKFGTPRKSQPFTGKNAAGMPQNYVVHSYGGYGSSLMTGYLMGTTSWMWLMPFHPAFYYSRPYEVANPDGSIEVYPPTFSWGKLFFTLLIFLAIVFIIYRIIKNRRMRNSRSYSQSSFT